MSPVVVSSTKSRQNEQQDGQQPTCADCAQLQQVLAETQSQLQATASEAQAAQAREAKLQAQVVLLQQLLFGRKSESAPAAADEPAGADTAAAESGDEQSSGPDAPARDEPVARRQRARGRLPGTPTPPRVPRSDLREVLEWLEVSASQRSCGECGTAYVRSGHKISWLYELAWQVYARKLLRQRYVPACECASARPVCARPAQRLGSSQLGSSVWAWSLVQVYGLFRPQAAVARDLAALGLRVPPSTLSAGLRRLADLCAPLEAAIGDYQQQQVVAQADETSWPVQWLAASEEQGDNKAPPARGQAKPKHWLWACVAGKTVRMRILPTRDLEACRQVLDPLVGPTGLVVLVCDCYSTYKAFAKLYPGRVVLAHCWAHVRRNFVRVGSGHAALNDWSKAWVKLIGDLFAGNRERLREWDPQQPLAAQSAAFKQCQQQLEAGLREVFERARAEGEQCIADDERLAPAERGRNGAELARVDAQGRALASLLRHRETLSRFLGEPRIPLDNNLSERVLRGPVIARYTSFGSGGPDGARAAGLLFGVLATVRLAGLNPYAWMLDWLAACARHGGQAPPQLAPWLPWRMSQQRREQLSQAPPQWCSGQAADSASELGKAA